MKKHYSIKTLFLLLLLIYNTPTNAQFLENHDTISTHGPHTITRNLIQDKNGIYWFATWEGIISYDGKVFTNITLKEQLGRFRVFSILEDRKGNLWFGTIGGGLYRYDGKSFIPYTTLDGLANNSVLCILEDRTGNIWFGTEEGVSKYDGKTFTNFTKHDGLNGNVNSILQDKTGKFWFGTRYGINGDIICYDGKTFSAFKNKIGLPFINVRSIIEDKAGNIWIGGQNGLICYDGESLKNVSTNFVGYIFEDKKGSLWISEEQVEGWVMNKFDGKSKTKIIGGSMFFGITEDYSGKIWVGTMNGISCYDGKLVTNFKD